MTERAQPTDLELAALISSKICHDVIGPVSAINNGLEIFDEEDDAQSKNYALDVIRNVTETASARLQFARFAFGAAGSAGAQIELGNAESLSRGLIGRRQAQADLARHAGRHGQGQGQAAAESHRRSANGDPARRRDRGQRSPGRSKRRASRCAAAVSVPVRRNIWAISSTARRRRSMRCRSRPTTRCAWRPLRACGSPSPRTARIWCSAPSRSSRLGGAYLIGR